MKQTAVEWLYGKSKLRELDKFDLEQAKEMEKEQSLKMPPYNLDELAEQWVFVINGHKWSINDDTAGDNFGSFKAGFLEARSILNQIIKSE